VEQAANWQFELTGGGEGMAVKPLEFAGHGRRGSMQPAIKCRGSGYLRIIYGLEYLLPEKSHRLGSRGVSTKRSLALREFALGIEARE
jgi:protein phosphatase